MKPAALSPLCPPHCHIHTHAHFLPLSLFSRRNFRSRASFAAASRFHPHPHGRRRRRRCRAPRWSGPRSRRRSEQQRRNAPPSFGTYLGGRERAKEGEGAEEAAAAAVLILYINQADMQFDPPFPPSFLRSLLLRRETFLRALIVSVWLNCRRRIGHGTQRNAGTGPQAGGQVGAQAAELAGERGREEGRALTPSLRRWVYSRNLPSVGSSLG